MRVALLTFVSALFAACIAPILGQPQGNSITINNDVATMNYALALEALEATYYSCLLYPLNNTNTDCNGRGYAGFSQAQFASEGFNTSVWTAVNLIAQQELSHQTLLNATIQAYSSQYGIGISPVPRCLYNIGNLGLGSITNVASYLSIARAVENVGVSAYAGAVNTITDPNLLQIAVSIADVEARHAAWLNQLLGVQPFASSGFDNATTPSNIAAAIGGVFVGGTSCVVSAGQSLPTTRPYGVSGNLTANGSIITGTQTSSGVSYSATERANDIAVLNYALTLEYLEAAFYNQAAARFTQANFTNAGLPSSAFTYFSIIAANENTHVAALQGVITAYGGTPVGPCNFTFNNSLSTFQSYLNTAQSLEDTGVSAYTGAANAITDTILLTIAAQITMIEARHAAYIRTINTNPRNDSNAFPNSRDSSQSFQQVIATVQNSGLVSSCPSLTTPVTLSANAGIPSSTAGGGLLFSSGSINIPSSSGGRNLLSSTGNGASSTSSLSLMMIIVAIIASFALLL